MFGVTLSATEVEYLSLWKSRRCSTRSNEALVDPLVLIFPI